MYACIAYFSQGVKIWRSTRASTSSPFTAMSEMLSGVSSRSATFLPSSPALSASALASSRRRSTVSRKTPTTFCRDITEVGLELWFVQMNLYSLIASRAFFRSDTATLRYKRMISSWTLHHVFQRRIESASNRTSMATFGLETLRRPSALLSALRRPVSGLTAGREGFSQQIAPPKGR